jgi:hypothetical protein
MNAIKGVVRNGQVVLDAPAELPEGTRVEVVPVESARPTLGMREEDWPTTPEGIAALLARMDQIEPLEMTEEERADLEAWRRKVKEYHLANWDRWARDVEGLFP